MHAIVILALLCTAPRAGELPDAVSAVIEARWPGCALQEVEREGLIWELELRSAEGVAWEVLIADDGVVMHAFDLADEEEIPLEALPEAIRGALGDRWSDMKAQSAERKGSAYELELDTAEGRRLEALFRADGSLVTSQLEADGDEEEDDEGATVAVPVSGTAWRIVPWCQGAAPPDGIGTTERPYRGGLHLRPGTQNSDVEPIAVARPDAEGRVGVALPPGPYCVPTDDRLDSLDQRLEAARARADSLEIDLGCVEQQWRRCRATLEVPDTGIEAARIDIVDHCSWQVPCSMAPIAPPPSAAPGG